jgi:hypothetical protein
MIALPKINKDARNAYLSKAGGYGASPEVPLLIESLESCSGVTPSTCFAIRDILTRLLQDLSGHKSTFARSNDQQAISVATDLFHQGNLVLEGVAGTGKTYLIPEIATHLHYLYASRTTERIGNQLKALTDVDPATLKATSEITAYCQSIKRFLEDLCLEDLAAFISEQRAQVRLVVMHPSSSYEELVIGLRPTLTDTGDKTAFRPKEGQLLKAILEASKSFLDGDITRPYLVVLDEINRCNVPAVLGELMLLVDSSRRLGEQQYNEAGTLKTDIDRQKCVEQGLGIRLPALAALQSRDLVRTGDLLFLPHNVYLLGTMNSSDRSILGFDQALRRRFPPKRIEPYTLEQWHKVLVALPSTLDPKCLGLLATEIVAWSALNAALRARIGPDAMVGHSYLFTGIAQLRTASPDLRLLAETLARMWQFDILPQVIHAAESAREEQFAKQLFDIPTDAVWKGKDALLTDSLKAVGVPVRQAATVATDLVNNGVGSFSQARAHRIVIAGVGHGQRLLIEATSAIKVEETKNKLCDASEYSNPDSEIKKAFERAFRLLDDDNTGALAARYPLTP